LPFLCKALHNKGKVERSVGYLRSSFLNGMDTSKMSLIAVPRCLGRSKIKRANDEKRPAIAENAVRSLQKHPDYA
jgi:transposase